MSAELRGFQMQTYNAVNLGVSLAVPDLVRMKQWEEIGRRVILATSIINSRKNATPAESAYIH